ncbi:MAG: 30S ribosomal protein S20 [Chloroflexi bacterium]|nr:30S ribosomal protein S20 [Chloroflexota bacterium]
MTSAERAARRDEKHRLRNRAALSATRTYVEKARLALLQGQDAAGAEQATLKAVQALDKAVVKGIYHKNTAARYKSQLMRQLRTLKAGPAPAQS